MNPLSESINQSMIETRNRCSRYYASRRIFQSESARKHCSELGNLKPHQHMHMHKIFVETIAFNDEKENHSLNTFLNNE